MPEDNSSTSSAPWEPTASTVADERKRRRAGNRRRGAIEWVIAIAAAVLIALVIKTWVAQAFVIPSGSMENTLLISDRVLVSKLTYRFSDVQRGDVIVFDNPDPKPGQPAQLIKRVIGLPGDQVTAANGVVSVNGEPQDETYVYPGNQTTLRGACTRYEDTETITVPPGRLLVLGDHREQSLDGRCFGPIDERAIVGKAFLRIWPLGRIGGL